MLPVLADRNADAFLGTDAGMRSPGQTQGPTPRDGRRAPLPGTDAGPRSPGRAQGRCARRLTSGGAAVLRVLREGDGSLHAVPLHLLDRLLGQRVHVAEANVVLVRRCRPHTAWETAETNQELSVTAH